MNNQPINGNCVHKSKVQHIKKERERERWKWRKAVSLRLVNSPEKKLPEAANLATSAAEHPLLPSVMGNPFDPMVPTHPYIPPSPPDIDLGSFADIDLVRYRLKTELLFSCS